MVITRDTDPTLSNLEKRIKESARNIKASQETISKNTDPLPRAQNSSIESSKRTMSGKRTIADITEIQKNLFPTDDKLSVMQIEPLYQEMVHLLQVCGFKPDYPDKLPVRKKYNLLLSKWDSQYEYPQKTMVYLKFCDCEPLSCPFDQTLCRCNTFNGFSDFYDDSTIIF